MENVSWFFNIIPWWVYVVAVIAVALMAWQFIAPLWMIAPTWLKSTIVAIGALFVTMQYGRNRGAQSERDKRAAANRDALQKRDKIDATIERLPASDVDKRLRDRSWLRDD